MTDELTPEAAETILTVVEVAAAGTILTALAAEVAAVTAAAVAILTTEVHFHVFLSLPYF